MQNSVTQWVEAAGRGDDVAASQLWEHCFPKLLRYVARRLPDNLRRAMDEEDVALSTLKSFYAGHEKGVFPDLKSRDELWKLLICIAARKAQACIRHELREKRGSGKVAGESIFINKGTAGSEPTGIQGIAGQAPTPEATTQFSEQFEYLLNLLSDDRQRTVAILRLEGYSVAEIAARSGCAVRTVERKLNLIRRTWTEAAQENTHESE